MKKTISTWWPLAMLLPLVLAFFMHAGSPARTLKKHEQTTVAGVSAELARAISYGLVADDTATRAIADTPNTL